MYDQASRDLGTGPVEAVDPMRAGAADVAFAAFHIGMALDGVGLMGEGAHSPGETALLPTLASQSKRMAILLSRLANEWGKPKK
jgi:glutamate carboxypeptidase